MSERRPSLDTIIVSLVMLILVAVTSCIAKESLAVKVKEGVKLHGLEIEMRRVLIVADEAFAAHSHWKEATVTSTTEGVHSAQSLHPYGYAVDFRIQEYNGRGGVDSLSPKQLENIVQHMRAELGPDYQVILEETHIHVEYQAILEQEEKLKRLLEQEDDWD